LADIQQRRPASAFDYKKMNRPPGHDKNRGLICVAKSMAFDWQTPYNNCFIKNSWQNVLEIGN
jgi:hypothetical protein